MELDTPPKADLMKEWTAKSAAERVKLLLARLYMYWERSTVWRKS